jgi:two-component system response regulator HydG
MITKDDFPSIMTKNNTPVGSENVGVPSGSTLKEAEKEIILRTLEETGGNRTHTAKILGISRRTLQLKLKEYGIN